MYTNGGKINILQIMPEFGMAGAEIMCENLCKQLHASGEYNVYVVSLFDFHSPITDRIESIGIQIFYLNKQKGLDIKIIPKLVNIMRDCNIDIIHTHRYVLQYSIPAAIISKVKVRVHTIHNIAEKEVDFCRQIIAGFFYRFCNVIPVSISPMVKESVIKKYRLNSKITPLVYNGIDLSNCIIKDNYDANNQFTFIHIGRFNTQKNHDSIIKAAIVLKQEGYNFRINLIGGGRDQGKWINMVKHLGLEDSIFFYGLQSNIYSFLNNSDCFILPSLYEGMPMALIEAMGTGLPIIASNVGGIPDMIHNGVSGLLIHPTPEELIKSMKIIMTNKNLREHIGKNALSEAMKFSAEQMFRCYKRIYESSM